MGLTRSDLLRAAGLAAGAAFTGGCTQVIGHFSRPELPRTAGRDRAEPGDPAWRVLNRAAYGPRPGDLERVHEIGVDAWIEEQLDPESIEEAPAVWARLLPFDTLEMEGQDAADWETASYPEVGKGPVAVELQQAAVLRSVYSRRQLLQVMVEFWTDHFNISQLKAECSWLKTADDRLIRRHAMGRFRDLVEASARSPAMLFYLDNDKNQRQDEETGSGPNENYARELLELHTLGVDGGYTLRDIQEVARCLTGWSYRRGIEWPPGQFIFRADRHDDGPKRVLGTTIPAGLGEQDGERVLDIVCNHPSTAHHIARKLCRRFVADRGTGALEAALAKVFTRTGGDIRRVLSTLLHSEEFQCGRGRKLKRPFDYAVSALRALNADTTGAGVLPHLERMGQLPFKWAMPDGYPDRAEAWTPGLLARWNFAVDLAANRIPGTTIDAGALRERAGSEPVSTLLCRLVLGRDPDAGLRRTLEHALLPDADEGARQVAALLLASPAFQWR